MVDDGDRLLVIFPFGLWPFRSQLDGVSWVLTQGMAAALSEVPGLAAYATTRGLVGSGPPVKVLRSLPPDPLVRSECRSLGADWALTGRILEDARNLEVWFNLIDGASGSLLWTFRQTPTRPRLIWFLTQGLRKLVQRLGLRPPEALDAHLVAPTTSFEALTAWVRAHTEHGLWRGERERAFDIVRDASRAAALDHDFTEAIELMVAVAEPLIEQLDDPLDVQRLRDSIIGDVSLASARRLRQAAHQRLLALAKRPGQT